MSKRREPAERIALQTILDLIGRTTTTTSLTRDQLIFKIETTRMIAERILGDPSCGPSSPTSSRSSRSHSSAFSQPSGNSDDN